jgi:hypothetical protein
MQRLSTGCISVKANKMWKQTKINHTFTFLTWCENFVFKCVNTCNSMYKLSMELMTFVIIILKSFKKALLNWIITMIAMKTFNMKLNSLNMIFCSSVVRFSIWPNAMIS